MSCLSPIARMDRFIDGMSEQVIDDYVKSELTEDINEDNRSHLKKYAGKLQHFHQQRKMFDYPMCDHPDSKGFRWTVGCDIPTGCLPKRPGSRRAEDEEQCYAKYNKTVFHEHLADRANCIHHKLALEFEPLEAFLQKLYGDIIIMYILQTAQYTLCLHVQVHLKRN